MYLTSQAVHASSEENDSQVFLVLRGIAYLKEAFQMDLKINHNFEVAPISETSSDSEKNETYDGHMPTTNSDDDGEHVLKILGGSLAKLIPATLKRPPNVCILNNKLIVKNQNQFECKKGCTPCYCEPELLFRERFRGARLFAIYEKNRDKIKCILCQIKVDREKLDEHFDNHCIVFKVSQTIYKKLNV